MDIEKLIKHRNALIKLAQVGTTASSHKLDARKILGSRPLDQGGTKAGRGKSIMGKSLAHVGKSVLQKTPADKVIVSKSVTSA